MAVYAFLWAILCLQNVVPKNKLDESVILGMRLKLSDPKVLRYHPSKFGTDLFDG